MSSTPSERSTYTRARDSSALMTSNEGFSVVAPMNVSVPSSTYGRKVSCCALLKRCTSSRNSTLRRPRSARAVRARSTASRMSLTPAMTADSCMNSASARRAMSRASVVLPVPGGPQRISEWSWPRSSAWRSGLPGAEHLLLPDEFIEVRGRMRSASGRSASSGADVAQQVGLPTALPAPRGLIGRARRCLTTMRRARASATRPSRAEQQAQRRAGGIRDHVARIAFAARMHVVLREFDGDAEQQQEHEDLPPANAAARGPRNTAPARHGRPGD